MSHKSAALLALLAVSALTACGGGSSKKSAGPTPPKPVVLSWNAAATLAIGQPDLVTGTAPATCGASTLNSPYGAAAWDGSRLFVADTNGNRVHVYAGVPTQASQAPSFDLGQAACATASTPTSASELSWPQSVRVAGAKLVVTDTTNHRVLVFNAIPTAAPASAAVAVGQPDLLAYTAGTCAANALDTPQSAFVTPDGKLIVADQGHHRVLIWNSLPSASGAAADLVLGQSPRATPESSFTTCFANDDPAKSLGTATARTLNAPADVWSDGTRLAIADAGNHRVLVWSHFPVSNGQAADAVIGQADFGPPTAGLRSDKLANPIALASDWTRLFVADAGNNRVLVFDPIPASGVLGPPATLAIGQADFASGIANQGLATPTERTLSNPAGLAAIDGRLFVADAGNNRVLVFGP